MGGDLTLSSRKHITINPLTAGTGAMSVSNNPDPGIGQGIRARNKKQVTGCDKKIEFTRGAP